MIPFVIVYSIIMFLIALSAVLFCVFTLRFNKREKRGNAPDGDFCATVFNGEAGSVHMIFETESKLPVYIGRSVKTFFGVSAEEVLNDTDALKNFLAHKDVRALGQAFDEWDGEELFCFGLPCVDGRFAKLEAFRTEYNGKRYTAITVHDITEEKSKLDTMGKDLQSAITQATAKSSFLSSMSHEIRTPMNGVMGMLSLAKMNIDDKEKVKSYLDRAGDLSQFLLGMINDILDISKIESGKMLLFNVNTDMFAFAEKIRNMFNSTVSAKGVNFVVETIDFTARYFVCDELRLTQVVTNLVSNANKFTPTGGSITVTFKQLDIIGGEAQIMIRVRDTGKGIAPENIHKIMRPFEQEEASTAHRYGGTGLGLAICDNIVRLMGGNITIDSVLGKGTDFSVFLSLPIADVRQDMDKPVEKAEKKPQINFTYEGCSILMAEDNEVNAEIAIDILESEGAKIVHAHDGQEAVDIFTEKPAGYFDCVLLDIQMPRLNGRDAARAIRSSDKTDAKSVPLIALSADAFVEDVKLSEAAGMDGHVSKPIDFDLLKQRIGEIIAAKKQQGVTQ